MDFSVSPGSDTMMDNSPLLVSPLQPTTFLVVLVVTELVVVTDLVQSEVSSFVPAKLALLVEECDTDIAMFWLRYLTFKITF
jgi:hypothetical protein